MNDTPPEIANLVRERLMAKTGAERVIMGSLRVSCPARRHHLYALSPAPKTGTRTFTERR